MIITLETFERECNWKINLRNGIDNKRESKWLPFLKFILKIGSHKPKTTVYQSRHRKYCYGLKKSLHLRTEKIEEMKGEANPRSEPKVFLGWIVRYQKVSRLVPYIFTCNILDNIASLTRYSFPWLGWC